MLIYLVRHGEAVENEPQVVADEDRELSDIGRKKIKKQSKGMAAIKICPDVILTGSAKRAVETALIIAKELDLDDKVEECMEITADGDIDMMVSLLAKIPPVTSAMIVGHEPSIGKLASFLLGSRRTIIEFKKGSVCCIEVSDLSEAEEGKLKYHLSPKQLRKLA